jgi:hypothetical protein
MSATVTWLGLDELRAALLHLPAELTQLATAIVESAADGAADEIRAAYPECDTGNLRKGVRVRNEQARGGSSTVRRVVRSTAAHASIFESGTQTRQTKLGYNRGFMPGANIFVPVVVRRRRDMEEDLIAVVEQAGIDVRR